MTRSNVLLGESGERAAAARLDPRIVPAALAQVLAYRLRSPGAAICSPSDRGAAMLPTSAPGGRFVTAATARCGACRLRPALVRRPGRDRRARQLGRHGLRESR